MHTSLTTKEVNNFKGYRVTKESSPFRVGEKQFHVINLDFSGVAEVDATAPEVKKAFVTRISDEAKKQHGIIISETNPGEALIKWMTKLIDKDSTKKIIMLIDEYDEPMTTFLPEDPEKVGTGLGLLGMYVCT